MDLLDASAVIAFLTAEPGAPSVRRILAGSATRITTVQLAEVVDKLARGRGVPVDRVQRAVEAIPGLSVSGVAADTGWRVGELRARHYDRRRCPISLADCVLIAAASAGDRIVSADRALVRVAKAEGVGVVALPPSR